jgi:hypothetical protein
MNAFEPIQGISLERYAELAAMMAGSGNNSDDCARIAASQGLTRELWQAVCDGWTARLRDPDLQSQVAFAFIPLYQAALVRQTGDAEPLPLAEFARITAEYSCRRDPADPSRPIDYKAVLQANGLNVIRWAQISTYWTPRINDPAHPASTQFKDLLKQASLPWRRNQE